MVTLSWPTLAIVLIAALAFALLGARRYGSSAILLAVLLLAVGGGLGIRIAGSEREVRRLVLVDVSASVAGDGRRALADPARLVGGLDGADEAAVYAFAGRAARVSDWTTADALREGGALRAEASAGRGTDLESALRVTTGVESRCTEILVFTDGRETRGRAAGAVEALRASGIRVTFRRLGEGAARDVRVRAIRAPTSVRSGEPFRLEVDVEGPPGSGVTLRLVPRAELDPPAPRPRTLRVGSDGRVRTAYQLEVDRHCRFHAEVSPGEGEDPLPDNDRMTAWVRVRGRQKIRAMCGSGPNPEFIRSLKDDGVEVHIHRRLSAEQLRTFEMMGGLVILLHDMPLRDVPPGIEAAVFRGAGLLVTGGERAFGPGAYAGSWLDRVLPVRSRRDDDDGLVIVVLADVSGSMNDPFAGATADRKARASRVAVEGLVEVLPPGSRVALLPFSERVHGAGVLRTRGREEDDAALRRDIESLDRDVRGGTNLALPLTRAAEITTPGRGRRHVVVVSDGEVSSDRAVLEALRRRRDELRAAGVTLSVIVTGGDETGRAVLRRLADEGSFHEAGSAGALAAALLEDLRRKSGEGLRMRGPARVRPAATAGDDAPLPQALALDSWLRTWPRRDARVVLETATDPSWPILAVGEHGLGRTAAVPATPGTGVGWGEGFWRELLGRLTPPETSPGLALHMERVDDTRVRVVLTARDVAGRFRTLDRPRLADGPALRPTGAGRYEATIEDGPDTEPDRPPMTVLEGSDRVLLTASPTWPRRREIVATGPDVRALEDLEALARAGQAASPTTERDVSWAPFLLAVLLLVVDAALKSRRKSTDGAVGGEPV